MPEPILVHNLTFSYDGQTPLICCAHLEFTCACAWALVGENGSGKTTFLELLLGLLRPDEGEISGVRSHSVGYVPDDNGLYESMTVVENIQFRLALYRTSYAARRQVVDGMLERYGLAGAKHTAVHRLSLGMRKKAALICAMAAGPSLLVLDEPTGGLDESARRELAAILRDYLRAETMVICTSHDADFLRLLSARVVHFPLVC